MLSPEKAKQIRIEFGQTIETYLVKGSGGEEPAVLGDSAIAEISKLVDGYIGNEELMAVVDATLVMSHLLDSEENSPIAAKRLGDIVARQNVLDGMQAIIDAERANVAEDTQKTAGEFSKFSDRPTEKTVPDVDAEKPDDAISLADIDFPKRL